MPFMTYLVWPLLIAMAVVALFRSRRYFLAGITLAGLYAYICVTGPWGILTCMLLVMALCKLLRFAARLLHGV